MVSPRRRERSAARRDRGGGSLQRRGPPTYLRNERPHRATAARSREPLLRRAVPLLGGAAGRPIVGNLAAAWLIVEVTTAASALLVAFSGRRDALEAGWKYLAADHARTLGRAAQWSVPAPIGQANLGHHGLHALDSALAVARARARCPRLRPMIAFVLLLAGLATDRLGAGSQLAAGRAQRGAGSDQRAAVRGAAERAVDRLAGEVDPGAVQTGQHHDAWRASSRSG